MKTLLRRATLLCILTAASLSFADGKYARTHARSNDVGYGHNSLGSRYERGSEKYKLHISRTIKLDKSISEHELKTERAVEYERLVREGRLAEKEAPPPTAESKWFGWTVGGTALALGIVAIVLIVYSIF